MRVVALVSVSSPGWLCCLRLRGILHQHVACGSFRRLPIRSFHASVSCDLAVTRRPARFASPGSARVANLSALFHAESSIGTLPSEVSPRSSPPDPLGSCRPPCRFPPPLQVMPRFRGFELFNAVSPLRRHTFIERMRSPTSALFTPTKGRSSLGRCSPSRVDLPASFYTSAEPPLLGFCRVSAPWLPCGRFSPVTRALFRVSEIRNARLVSESPSVGFLSPQPRLLET